MSTATDSKPGAATSPIDIVDSVTGGTSGHHPHPRPRKIPTGWLALVAVIALVAWAVISVGVPTVRLVRPRQTVALETLATSGVVEGRLETTLGADAQGTLVELRVDENDQVRKGQLLARVQGRQAQGQVEVARATLERAQAQLRQVQTGPTANEVVTAASRVSQAEDAVDQAEASLERARIAVSESEASIRTAMAGIERAKANREQARSRLDLAQKTYDRTQTLAREGAVSGARLDSDRTARDVSQAALTDAEQSVLAANFQLRAAQLARDGAQASVRQAASNVSAARSAVTGAKADLSNLQSLPRTEAIGVAAAQVQEAAASLKAAEAATQNYEIRAPFDGTITQVLCRTGGLVTSQGILRLVETGRLEAKADIDESHLGQVHLGQRAVLTTSSDPDRKIDARVARISSHVDATRGTVELVVLPVRPTSALQAGQTIDVTIVVNEHATRLVLPNSALRRKGDETVVFVVESGRATARPVGTGQSSTKETAILDGISPADEVVQDVAALQDGQRVRVQR